MRCADTTRSSDGDAQLVEHRHGRLQGREIGAAATDDPDDRFARRSAHRSPSFVSSSAQRSAAGGRPCSRQRLVDIAAGRRHVPHLAAFEHRALVVEMEMDRRIGQCLPDPQQPRVATQSAARAG